MTAEERADILVKAWNSAQPFTARLNKKAIKSLIETMSAGMNAAHIEALRRAKELCQSQVHSISCILAIDAEIAALERGRENGSPSKR